MLSLVTAPTTEPVTTTEARRQLLLNATAGEPAPTAPTVALISPAAAGNCDNGAWRVAFSFSTADGETELGPLSDLVTVADKAVNGKIAISNIALGGSSVTARKGYAIAPGGTSALYFGTIADNTTTTATLNLASTGLGVAAPSVNTTVDPELSRLISATRDRGELATRRSWTTQTWDDVRAGFPCGGVIELERPPLQSVTYVHYVDTAGVTQTLSSSLYTVTAPSGPRCARGTIALNYGQVWPSTRTQFDAVTIRFVAGYGAAAAVPALLKSALLIDLATLYAQRENVITGTIVAELPYGTAAIYRSFKSYARYAQAVA